MKCEESIISHLVFRLKIKYYIYGMKPRFVEFEFFSSDVKSNKMILTWLNP